MNAALFIQNDDLDAVHYAAVLFEAAVKSDRSEAALTKIWKIAPDYDYEALVEDYGQEVDTIIETEIEEYARRAMVAITEYNAEFAATAEGASDVEKVLYLAEQHGGCGVYFEATGIQPY